MWQRTFEIENILDFFFKFAHYSQGGDHPYANLTNFYNQQKIWKEKFSTYFWLLAWTICTNVFQIVLNYFQILVIFLKTSLNCDMVCKINNDKWCTKFMN